MWMLPLYRHVNQKSNDDDDDDDDDDLVKISQRVSELWSGHK